MRTPFLLLCSSALLLASHSTAQLIVPASRAKLPADATPKPEAAASTHPAAAAAAGGSFVSLAHHDEKPSAAPKQTPATHHVSAVHHDAKDKAAHPTADVKEMTKAPALHSESDAKPSAAAAHEDKTPKATPAPKASVKVAGKATTHAAQHKPEAPATKPASHHMSHDTKHHETMHGANATPHPAAHHADKATADSHTAAATAKGTGHAASVVGGKKGTPAPKAAATTHKAAAPPAPRPTLIPKKLRVSHIPSGEQSMAGPVFASIIAVLASLAFVVFAVYVLCWTHIKAAAERCKTHGVRGLWMLDGQGGRGLCTSLEMCEEKGGAYSPPAMVPVEGQISAPHMQHKKELSRRSTSEEEGEVSYLL